MTNVSFDRATLRVRDEWARMDSGPIRVRAITCRGSMMSSSTLGVDVPAWGGRRAQEALERVRSIGRRRKAPCVICGQPIDYSLPGTHPDGCTVQHIKSRKLFPQLTWAPSNHAPAHRACNTSAGDGTRNRDVGVTSQEW